jgi:hypothetical protein
LLEIEVLKFSRVIGTTATRGAGRRQFKISSKIVSATAMPSTSQSRLFSAKRMPPLIRSHCERERRILANFPWSGRTLAGPARFRLLPATSLQMLYRLARMPPAQISSRRQLGARAAASAVC